MSVFRYHKPAIGNASSYVVSGTPFIKNGVAPIVDETSAVVNFPRVTNYVTIKNTNDTDVGLRITFNNESVVDNTNYFILDRGESFSAELRTTDVHLMSDGDSPVSFTVIAGLTNIERSEMTQLTPTPPNLLAWVQKQKLIANDPDGSPEGDFFGRVTMTSDGRILAAGASSDEENGSGAGSVYIFQNGSGGYQQVQKLTASGDADPAGDFFGTSLSFSSTGEKLAIGALVDEENGGTDAGSVYIFQSGSTGYQQVQKLTASGEVDPTFDQFGRTLVFSSTGETLAVGADRDEENGGSFAGSVYIFQSGSTGYQQVQKLTASGDADPAGDAFGFSLSISSTGEILAVGAYGDEENGGSFAGSVYIFQSGSLGYQQVQKLTASGDANPYLDYFGYSVSISSTGETVAIGARYDEENGGSQAGSVYIFQSGSGGYQQVQKLTASGDANPAGDQFGYVVSISSTGEIVAIGSRDDEENGTGAGSVYIFQSGSLGYQQTNKLTASFGTDGLPEVSPEGDRFGADFISLNIARDVISIGARSDEENGGANAGSVYIFKYTRDY